MNADEQSLKPEEQSHWFLFKEAMTAQISKNDIGKYSAERAIYQGEKIIQIVPAQGAVALFDDAEYLVLCWCLKEESWILDGDPETIMRVVGMIMVGEQVGLSCVDGPDCCGDFIEYRYS